MTPELTIVVPVYNEEDNLLRLEHALLKFMNNAKRSVSILFIDDGSSDNSHKLLEQICSRQSHFNTISLSENNGLSKVLKIGFNHIDSPLIGYIDADLQTSPDEFHLLLEYIDSHDLVTGIRVGRKDSIFKIMISKMANNARRLITNDNIVDTCCPLKIIRTDYAKRIPLFNGMHRFIPALVLLQKGKVKEIPVQHFNRVAGKSSYGLWNRFFVSIKSCYHYLRIKRNYSRSGALKKV